MFLDLFVNCGDGSLGASAGLKFRFCLKAAQLSVSWACNEARLHKTMIDRGKLVRLLKALGPPVKQYPCDVDDQVPTLL